MKRRLKVTAALALVITCIPFLTVALITLFIGMALYSASEELTVE